MSLNRFESSTIAILTPDPSIASRIMNEFGRINDDATPIIIYSGLPNVTGKIT
jgi:hypothetical protein